MSLSATPAPLMTVARPAVAMFFAFAFAYFLSALLRAVTATLAPAFSGELGLSAGDLGLLAGAYFLGFSLTQLPLGQALDRFGPRRVLLVLLSVAVLACMAFALAKTLTWLWLARALIGVGVSACLMAPLTAYRHHFGDVAQLRANSWMLMTGSLGMLASTLPVQWLLPMLGWRGLFWWVAGLLLIAMALIVGLVPRDQDIAPPARQAAPAIPGYGAIFRHPYFVRLAPLAFVVYGGLVAVQSLWAGPWLTAVAGRTPGEAAQGLFLINLAMLLAFFSWGVLMPPLRRRGVTVNRLIALGVPVSLGLLLGCRTGPGGRRHVVGSMVRVLHVRVVESAGAGAGLSTGVGRARAVGLQPGHLCRRLLRAMGHRPGDRRFDGARLGPTRRGSRCVCAVWPLCSSVICVVSAAQQ